VVAVRIVKLRDGWALGLAALLAVAGVAHFVSGDSFDAIVPHVLPGSAWLWTSVSGVVELVLALAVAWPRTRRSAATITAVFFVLVFPANVQMAVDWASHPTPEFAAALLRLPLQLPLIWWAWHVRTRAAMSTRVPTVSGT
jgi:uncharacterized membrane protein